MLTKNVQKEKVARKMLPGKDEKQNNEHLSQK